VSPSPALWVSIAFDDIPDPDYADAIIVPIPESVGEVNSDPEWWARRIFDLKSAPKWILSLLRLRQRLVGLIGVEKSDQSVFEVDRVDRGEALIAENDRHLDFRAGVRVDRESRLLQVTTVVRLKGWRGRLYWIPVGLIHGPLTRSLVRNAARRAKDSF
jgi:hypothetical protein